VGSQRARFGPCCGRPWCCLRSRSPGAAPAGAGPERYSVLINGSLRLAEPGLERVCTPATTGLTQARYARAQQTLVVAGYGTSVIRAQLAQANATRATERPSGPAPAGAAPGERERRQHHGRPQHGPKRARWLPTTHFLNKSAGRSERAGYPQHVFLNKVDSLTRGRRGQCCGPRARTACASAGSSPPAVAGRESP
jgi:hypothetical protein